MDLKLGGPFLDRKHQVRLLTEQSKGERMGLEVVVPSALERAQGARGANRARGTKDTHSCN